MEINVHLFITETTSDKEKKHLESLLGDFSSWMFESPIQERMLHPVEENSIWEVYNGVIQEAAPNDVIIFYGEEVGELFCKEVVENGLSCWSGTHIFCQYGEELPPQLSQQKNIFVVGQTNIATANAFSTCLYGAEVYDRHTGKGQTLREKIFGERQTIKTALIIYSDDAYGRNNRDLIKTVLQGGGFCQGIEEKEVARSEWQSWAEGDECLNTVKKDHDLIYLIGRGEDFLDAVSKIAQAAEPSTVLFVNQSLKKPDVFWGDDSVKNFGKNKQLYYLSPRVRPHFFAENCKNIDEVWLGSVMQMLMTLASDQTKSEVALSDILVQLMTVASDQTKSEVALSDALVQKHHFHSPFGTLAFHPNRVSFVDQWLCRNPNGNRLRYVIDADMLNLSSGKNFKGEIAEILDNINDYFARNGKPSVVLKDGFLSSLNTRITKFVQELFRGVEDVSFSVLENGDETFELVNRAKIRRFNGLMEQSGVWNCGLSEFYQYCKRLDLIDQTKVVGSDILQINCGVEDIECNNTSRIYFCGQTTGEKRIPLGLYRGDSKRSSPMGVRMTIGSSWNFRDFSQDSRLGSRLGWWRLVNLLQNCQRGFIYVIPGENGILSFESYLVLITSKPFSSVELALMSMICAHISSLAGSLLENSGDKLFKAWLKIGAVMSRNLAHNLGSHVLSTLAHTDVPRGKKDEEYRQFLSEDQELYRYLQHRMAYLTFATTTFPTWSVPMEFVGTVMRTFLRQSHLLNKIAVSEGLETWNFRTNQNSQSAKIRLHICRMNRGSDEKDIWKGATEEYDFVRYQGKEESINAEKDVRVRMVGDVIGQQAFFCILENVIRNAAKHGWAHPPARTRTTKTDGGNLDIFIEFIEDDSQVHFCIYDNISDVDEAFADEEIPIMKEWEEKWKEKKRKIPEKGIHVEDYPLGNEKHVLPLHVSQHERLLKTIKNGLSDNTCLGLSEMRISVGLLRGRSVLDIGNAALDDVLDLDAVAVTRKGESVRHLGYAFDIPLACEVLVVVDDLNEYNKYTRDRPKWRRNGIAVKKFEEIWKPTFRFGADYVVFSLSSPWFISPFNCPLRTFVMSEGETEGLDWPRIDKNDFTKAVGDETGMKLKNLVYRSWIRHLKELHWGKDAEKHRLSLFVMPVENGNANAQGVYPITLPMAYVPKENHSDDLGKHIEEPEIGIRYLKSASHNSRMMRHTKDAILYHRHCDIAGACSDFKGIYFESLSASQDEFNLINGLRSDDFATMTKLVETGLLRIAIADERVANQLRGDAKLLTVFRMMKIAVLDDKKLISEMDADSQGDAVAEPPMSNGQPADETARIEIEHVWEKDGLATIDVKTLKAIIHEISQLNDEALAKEQDAIGKAIESVSGKIADLQRIVKKYRDQFDVLIIHQGIIDKWLPLEVRTAQHEAVLLGILQKLVPYVIVTTGRGRPANIPATARVLPFEVISNALFKPHPEKDKVVEAIMNLMPDPADGQ